MGEVKEPAADQEAAEEEAKPKALSEDEMSKVSGGVVPAEDTPLPSL